MKLLEAHAAVPPPPARSCAVGLRLCGIYEMFIDVQWWIYHLTGRQWCSVWRSFPQWTSEDPISRGSRPIAPALVEQSAVWQRLRYRFSYIPHHARYCLVSEMHGFDANCLGRWSAKSIATAIKSCPATVFSKLMTVTITQFSPHTDFIFLPRDAMPSRGVSVCVCVCHVRESCENEQTYIQKIFTVG